MVIVGSLYFFLPVYIALFMPILARTLHFGERIVFARGFGKNKTWRGVIVIILTAGVVFIAQKLLYVQGLGEEIAVIDYTGFSWLYGVLLGIGGVAGDLWKSYAKRKENITEGESWFMMDYFAPVFGALIVSFVMYVPPIEIAIFVLLWGMVIQWIVERLVK